MESRRAKYHHETKNWTQNRINFRWITHYYQWIDGDKLRLKYRQLGIKNENSKKLKQKWISQKLST